MEHRGLHLQLPLAFSDRPPPTTSRPERGAVAVARRLVVLLGLAHAVHIALEYCFSVCTKVAWLLVEHRAQDRSSAT